MDLSVTILCWSDSSCKTFCRHLLAFPHTPTLQLHKSCSVYTILKTYNLFTKWTSKFDIFAIATIVLTTRRSSDTLHCHRKEFETIDCTLKVQAFHLQEHLVVSYLVPQRKFGWLVAPGLFEGKHRRCVCVCCVGLLWAALKHRSSLWTGKIHLHGFLAPFPAAAACKRQALK